MTDAEIRSESIDAALRTALDLCLGLGAFVVTMTGVVHRVISDAMPPDDGWRRIEVLARNCLSHPAANGRDLFWNAEVSTEAGSVDRSLACAVMPVWSGDTELGLLGVVDTWLPEPDGYQRTGLSRLASDLSALLRQDAGPPPPAERHLDPAATGVGPGVRAAPEPSTSPSGDMPAAPAPAVTAAGAPAGTAPAATGTAPAAPAQSAPSSPGTAPGPAGTAASAKSAPAPAGIDAAELIASLDDGIMCLDATGTVVLANRAADAMHDLAPGSSLLGSTLPPSSGLRTEDGEVLSTDRHPAMLALHDGVARDAHLTLGEGGDTQRHVAVSARPFPIDGQRGVLVVLRDTTTEWMEQQRLTHYALYDPLTGLANRYLLLEELRRMLQGLARRGGSVALIYMDLDDFKRINDDHGHAMGDEVLGAFARRLRGAVRSDDVVARLGGDEFVIAHATSEQPPDGDLVVSRLRKVLSAPFTVRAHTFDVGASIGWVSTDKGEDPPDALLARADRAMYRHKRDRALARRSTA